MTTAALTALVLTGFAAGLLAQFLTVYYRLEPQPVPLAYISTGVIGAAGALCFIPLIMLANYGVGRSGSQSLSTLTVAWLVFGGLVAATNALLIAKALELGNRRVRLTMLVTVSMVWVLFALGVLWGGQE
jgi:hypothetical protein